MQRIKLNVFKSWFDKNLTGKEIDFLLVLSFYPMRRKTPCFSYGDIRRVHRIYASN